MEVSGDVAPIFVAFRDGDGDWQRATVVTPTKYGLSVQGPSYMVTIVCESEDHTLQILQLGRTVKESHDLVVPCRSAAKLNPVPGVMVQAGQVQLGESSVDAAAGKSFTLNASAGSHDLIASTADRIVVRREVAVVAEGQAAIPQIDLSAEGSDLAEVALTVDGAAEDEAVQAKVSVVTPTTSAGAPIYSGAVNAVKIAPEAALKDTDVQTVAVVATSGAAQRTLQRKFRVGGAAAFKLPDPIDGAHWKVEGDQLVATWSKLPELDSLVARVAGVTADPSQQIVQTIELSDGFVSAAGITRAEFDSEIPGYHAEWKVDPSRGHARALVAEHADKDDVATSSFTEKLTSAPSAR
ncbi:MAG TPA: hypothetical protein VFT22_43250 [Kofleriaceae bacterium]|nr:hypothetical protein [Kofleriaceae bacterium]